VFVHNRYRTRSAKRSCVSRVSMKMKVAINFAHRVKVASVFFRPQCSACYPSCLMSIVNGKISALVDFETSRGNF
jgi:hypothetical protein